MTVYLLNWLFIVLLAILFFLWYLFFKIKKWYLILIFLLILIITFYYYTYIFSFLFGWNLNFYWVYLALIFIIFAIVAIILSIFKNKSYFLIFITLCLILLYNDSLKHIKKNIDDYNFSNYLELAKDIVWAKWDVYEENKQEFIKLSNEVYSDYEDGWELWISGSSIKEAKQILWMYELEYCKKYNSDSCYLEFIYWKSLLESDKSFFEKYRDYTFNYWEYIKKDLILKWLNKDLRKNIKWKLDSEFKYISTDFNIWPNLHNSYDFDIIISNDKITLKKYSANIILKKEDGISYDIEKTKELIDERINYLKNNYITDLTHEKLEEKYSNKSKYDLLWINDWITVKLSIYDGGYVLWYDIPMSLYLDSEESAFKYFKLIYAYLLQTSIDTDDIRKINTDNHFINKLKK